MKCEYCGQQFRGREARYDTRSDAGEGGRRWKPTRTVLIALCPECAKSRGGMMWFWLRAIAAIIVALTAAKVVANWYFD